MPFLSSTTPRIEQKKNRYRLSNCKAPIEIPLVPLNFIAVKCTWKLRFFVSFGYCITKYSSCKARYLLNLLDPVPPLILYNPLSSFWYGSSSFAKPKSNNFTQLLKVVKRSKGGNVKFPGRKQKKISLQR